MYGQQPQPFQQLPPPHYGIGGYPPPQQVPQYPQQPPQYPPQQAPQYPPQQVPQYPQYPQQPYPSTVPYPVPPTAHMVHEQQPPLRLATGEGQQPAYPSVGVDQPLAPPPPPASGGSSSAPHGTVFAAATIATRVMEDNPFGPGSLPHVTRVTQEMRLKRALEVARHYVEQQSSPAGVGVTEDDVKAAAEALSVLARNEHNPPQLEMTDDLAKHEARLGSGILYLFSFHRFLFALTLVFALFQCVTFGDYIRRHSPYFGFGGVLSSGRSISWIDNFMISGYDNDHDEKLWKAMNIVCIILYFFCGPIYFWWLRWNEKTSKFVDVDGEDVIFRFTDDAKLDVSNLYSSRTKVVFRRLVSLAVVLFFIGVQVIASYFITQNSVTNIGISFAISFVVAILNILFLMIAERLTEFECWARFDQWKRYHTLKLIFFRFANIITVFAAKRYDSGENQVCAYDLIGEQLITLLVIDIFAVNLQQLIMNMVWNKFTDTYANVTGSILGDQDNMPKFDIALEYLAAVYRHYLVILAMVVFPFSVLLSLLGYAIDYVTKKFILVKLSGLPRKVESSQKSFLTGVLFFAALCGLLTPYAGSAFLLSGMTKDRSHVCTFP